jgi:beta-glucosidase
MAAALTKGVQAHPGRGTTVKHFAANNQEFNRYGSNSHVSERALREIYLRGFEIAVREGDPKAVMTSYNDINGVPSADNHDLVTAILRDEWGFHGLVMTDWGGGVSTPAISMYAGNDMIQPGGDTVVEALKAAVEAGEPVVSQGAARVTVTPTRAMLERSAVHILDVILRTRCFRRRRG